jgi:hypothetical protein
LSKKPFLTIAPSDFKKDLKVDESILLKAIEKLDKRKGCYATNEYFYEYFNKTMSIPTISRKIHILQRKDYVRISYSNHKTKRTIHVNNKYEYSLDKQTVGVIRYMNKLLKKNYVKELIPNDPHTKTLVSEAIVRYRSSDALLIAFKKEFKDVAELDSADTALKWLSRTKIFDEDLPF